MINIGKQKQEQGWVKKNSRKIFDSLTIASNIGLWVFLLFILHLHWSHYMPFSYYSDYKIELDTLTDNGQIHYYHINNTNSTFKINFMLSNTWTQQLDAEFDIIHDGCIQANYSCNDIHGICQKSQASREYILKNILQQQIQYITVDGIFTNCTNVVTVCLYVNEPNFRANQNHRCVEFNPLQADK